LSWICLTNCSLLTSRKKASFISLRLSCLTSFSVLPSLDAFLRSSKIVSSKLLGSYSSASGTSMSAPFVTGAFALYRSAKGIKSVDEVVADFQLNGVTVKDSYTNIQIKKINFVSIIKLYFFTFSYLIF
jgi:subtilisin family serine protease